MTNQRNTTPLDYQAAPRKPSSLLGRISLIFAAAAFLSIPISILHFLPHGTSNELLETTTFLCGCGFLIGAASLCFESNHSKPGIIGILSNTVIYALLPSFMCA